jgi:hypothetical protein
LVLGLCRRFDDRLGCAFAGLWLVGNESKNAKIYRCIRGPFCLSGFVRGNTRYITTLYEFDGFNLVWDSAMGIDNGSYGRDHGIAYIGNNGTLILNRGGWEIIEEKQSKNKISKPFEKPSDNGLNKHWENFVQVVKSRKMEDLHCSIQAGAHVATVSQMGNIAFRSGQKLFWDATKNKFTDDAYK